MNLKILKVGQIFNQIKTTVKQLESYKGEEEKNLKGEVISVGPGYYSGMGTFIETVVKKGDIVLLPQMGPTKVDYEGEEYYMIEENKILGIIEK